MADDDGGPDFDVDMGDGGGSQDGDRGQRRDADEVDELEDLSREELYDRLKDANNTAKKYRLRLKRARQGGAGRAGDRDDEDGDRRQRDDRGSRDDDRRSRRRDDRDDDRDDDRGSRRQSSRAAELEERAIRAEAKTYLAAAGIPADRLARAVRLINLDDLELDGEDLLGIDEEIEDLKEEWPELFRKSRSSRDDDGDDRDSRRDSGRRDSGTRRRVSRADARAGGGTGGRDRGKTQKTSTEIAAEQLMGLRDR